MACPSISVFFFFPSSEIAAAHSLERETNVRKHEWFFTPLKTLLMLQQLLNVYSANWMREVLELFLWCLQKKERTFLWAVVNRPATSAHAQSLALAEEQCNKRTEQRVLAAVSIPPYVRSRQLYNIFPLV